MAPWSPLPPALLDAARAQDQGLAAQGLELWLGAEPTFTLRESTAPPWLTEPDGAVGSDKDAWARRLTLALAARLAPVVGTPVITLPLVGRHYPDEDAPRFCYGVAWSRRPHAPLPAGFVPAPLDAAPVPTPDFALADVALLTVTPDPAVVEVNLAPAPDLATFAAGLDATYAAAADVGLSPVRYHFNGTVGESGGGNQLTFGGGGGPGGLSPETSPFFKRPALLPRLLAALNHHPALSYWFASDAVGSAGQGPRPDEGTRERFDEFCLALNRWLPRGHDADAAKLWPTFAPLLVDASGNSHRAEVNIEKLDNPHFGARGRWGVVELRAHRMPPDPVQALADAALQRALLARVALVDDPGALWGPPRDWGAELHDRFALPSVLREDLEHVLDDLDAHGFGLPAPLRAPLFRRFAPTAVVELAGRTLTVTRALEFWPLVGDVASQETAGSRLVDASSRRFEVRVDVSGAPGDEDASPGAVIVDGARLPLRHLKSGGHVAGVRHRVFVPLVGFHPDLSASDRLTLEWAPDGTGGPAIRVELFDWIPGGGVYDGLPADADEASRRRAERVVVTHLDAPRHVGDPTVSGATAASVPARWTLDLREPLP